MEEIVKRLHEQRRLEQARAILESAGYSIESINESNGKEVYCSKCGTHSNYTDADVKFDDNSGEYYVACDYPGCHNHISINPSELDEASQEESSEKKPYVVTHFDKEVASFDSPQEARNYYIDMSFDDKAEYDGWDWHKREDKVKESAQIDPNFDDVNVGDVVKWSTENMDIPEVGETFRVGPIIGKCLKVDDDSVTMEITGHTFRESKYIRKEFDTEQAAFDHARKEGLEVAKTECDEEGKNCIAWFRSLEYKPEQAREEIPYADKVGGRDHDE